MKGSTNPFDDYDETGDSRKISGHQDMGISTNPFDDDADDDKDDSIAVANNESGFRMSDYHHHHHDANVMRDDRMFERDEDVFDPSRTFEDDLGDDEDDLVGVEEDENHHLASHENENENQSPLDSPVEDSWQFLGDLPYRRVSLYKDVLWGNTNEEEEEDDYGLAFYSRDFLEQRHQFDFAQNNMHEMLLATTVTKVTGCPMGGPVASVTIPVSSDTLYNNTQSSSDAIIRIMTSSGHIISTISFPPDSLTQQQQSMASRQKIKRNYSAADILTIGFTNRTLLIVVLRDSLCLTFDLQGKEVLPPFYILPHETQQQQQVLEASVFEGGVAVLGSSMTTAVVELLDNYDDPSYVDSAHVTARKIFPKDSSRGDAGIMGGMNSSTLPQNFALVTILPTAAHASANYYSYCTLAVLPRIHTNSRHPELFLSTSDNSVVVANTSTGDITDVDCRSRISSPIVSMSFAPNGRFLACFTQSLLLTVISTSFETKVLDFDTSKETSSPPRDMKWCGEDSVVLHWKNIGVLMVGPYGDWLRFPYENTDNLCVVPEIDCCRVITDHSVEILQRVPPATAQLLRIGSIEPSAMLLDASDAFESGSPSSDEAARAINKTGMLLDAIETCIDAAVKEFDIPMQKRLLRAASYGMHFAYKDPSDKKIMGGNTAIHSDGDFDNHLFDIQPSSTAIKFVSIAKKIRVMNALRDPQVGFALTSSQFDSISANGVISRLIAMQRAEIATAICAYLDLDKTVQSFARASRAVAYISSCQEQTDALAAETAISILNEDIGTAETSKATIANLNRGAFALVALAAHKAGKSTVANLLLRHEKSTRDKVLALIKIGSYSEAAAVAVNARDADLAFSAIIEFEKHTKTSDINDPSKSRTKFLSTVDSKFHNESYHLYRSYLSSMNTVTPVLSLLKSGNNNALTGATVAQKALRASKDERKKLMQEASRIFNVGRDTSFQKTCTDEYLELISEQERLRSAYNANEIAPENSSVSSTIFNVVSYAAVRPKDAHRILMEAEKLARKFRVPDKRFWHIRVKAFAASGQWPNLKSLADSRTKPPIGMKHFALAVIKGNQGVGEIMRYIDKVTDPEERYDLFCEAQLWKRALDEAKKLGDAQRIMHVRSLTTSPEIQSLCDELAATAIL